MIKIKFALFLINAGIKFLPKEFRNKTFINNCISTQIIKLNGDNND